MKKSYLLISAAALAMLAACNKENSVQDFSAAEGRTLSLTLEAVRGDEGEKTSMTYNDNYGSLQSVWASGDVVYVYSRKSGEQLGTLAIDPASIANEGGGSTSQWATSKASFSGAVTLGVSDNIKDDFAFVYQGAGRSLAVAEGLLTYPMGTSANVAGLNAWDVAYASGKIQGSAASASCSVSFGNKVGFGYFTTEGLSGTLKGQYYEAFTLDVRTGILAGVSGEVTLPAGSAFYMPLIPGAVNISCGRQWSDDNTFTEIGQSVSFTAAAASYYRMGRNAAVPFGPVAFEQSDAITYNTMKDKLFAVAADKDVYFTPGNLQYIGSKVGSEHWQLASSQYSIKTCTATPANAESGVTYTGDVEYFGWGEVDPPFHGSTVNGDYQPSITTANVNLTTDWATKFNDGTKLYQDYSNSKEFAKQGGEYLVLTKDEWGYLFNHQYWGFAEVTLTNGLKVKGVVVLPKNITEESAAKAIVPDCFKGAYAGGNPTARYSDNALDQAVLDAAGALFLPAAGCRVGTSFNNVGSYGHYWSKTSYSATSACIVFFRSTGNAIPGGSERYYGMPIRLAVASE